MLHLGWALPTPVELASFKLDMRTKLASADEQETLIGGDWFLYLSHVHLTKSMHVRKWVWALTLEFKRVIKERMAKSGLNDLAGGEKSPERVGLEGKVALGFVAYKKMCEGDDER